VLIDCLLIYCVVFIVFYCVVICDGQQWSIVILIYTTCIRRCH